MEQAVNQEDFNNLSELTFEGALDPALFLQNELYYTFWRIIVLSGCCRKPGTVIAVRPSYDCSSWFRMERQYIAAVSTRKTSCPSVIGKAPPP